jgi:hypothetical protein
VKTALVAALFVDPRGTYASMLGVVPWTIGHDARAYAGPHPVVAHPPCQLWGKFARVNYARWGGENNRPGNDGGCFASALASVRRWGGVLEHPATSYAWEAHGLRKPDGIGWLPSSDRNSFGLVCEVWQSAYGHKARKRTWLYYVGSAMPADLRWDRPEGTHQIGFCDRKRGAENNKPTISGRAASASPPAFAAALVSLARKSRNEKLMGAM